MGSILKRKGKTKVAPVRQIEHSEACRFASDCYAQFSAVRPNHCPTCHGHGNTGRPEDPSVGMYAPAECADCVGQGKCPICGHQHGEEWEGYRCENLECGWDEDDERTHSPYMDCECGLIAMEAELAEAGYDTFEMLVEGEEEYPGNVEGEIDFAASDFAYDADRERRIFGR